MKIYIANDHRGYKLKMKIVKYLTKKGYEVEDLGTNSESPVDYPIYAFDLSKKVVDTKDSLGIAICGSGIGISIACNKVKGIRCAKVNNVKEARYSRIDNDANIVAISGKTPYLRTLDIIDAFITTRHLMSERHDRRIGLITKYENKLVNKIKEDTVDEPIKRTRVSRIISKKDEE